MSDIYYTTDMSDISHTTDISDISHTTDMSDISHTNDRPILVFSGYATQLAFARSSNRKFPITMLIKNP